jgi:hypothetical protein
MTGTEALEPFNKEVYFITWKEVQGNPLLAKLNPEMLTPGGHLVTGMFKIKGKSKKKAYPATVSYDREYLIKYLVSKLFRPLSITKFEEIQMLVSEAWDVYKKENKQ